MSDYEVLATGLADQPRVRAVVVDVLAHRAPHSLEHLGGPCEVDARQVLVAKYLLRDLRRAAADHVDDAGRQACLIEDLHQEMANQKRLRRWFEDDGVAHKSSCGGKVGPDGREVERADREHESL